MEPIDLLPDEINQRLHNGEIVLYARLTVKVLDDRTACTKSCVGVRRVIANPERF